MTGLSRKYRAGLRSDQNENGDRGKWCYVNVMPLIATVCGSSIAELRTAALSLLLFSGLSNRLLRLLSRNAGDLQARILFYLALAPTDDERSRDQAMELVMSRYL